MAATPNFAAGKAFIESHMRDECVVTRDSSGTQDDDLNLITGILDSDDPVEIYSGKCDVKEPTGLDPIVIVGGHEQTDKQYRILIPLRVTEVRQGDILEVTSTFLDPRLVGHKFRVDDVSMGTNKVYRQLDVSSLDLRLQVPN